MASCCQAPFTQALDQSGELGAREPPSDAAFSNLRVVGMRIDPCFAALSPAADGVGCQNQLRLVVQEVVNGTIYDSALHLFYAISREEVTQLVKVTAGLRQALKPKRRLGQLQPHPIMVEQGPDGSRCLGLRHPGQNNPFKMRQGCGA